MLSTSASLLKIIVPYDLTGKTGVAVYRYHDGIAVAMTEAQYSTAAPADECFMVNTAGNKVIIWAQRFSTYAISYLSEYTISYDCNGAASGSVPSSETVTQRHGLEFSRQSGQPCKKQLSIQGLGADRRRRGRTVGLQHHRRYGFLCGMDVPRQRRQLQNYGNGRWRAAVSAPTAAFNVTRGCSRTFTVTAENGYKIDNVSVDGTSVERSNLHLLKHRQ
jgi:hypothetical protein